MVRDSATQEKMRGHRKARTQLAAGRVVETLESRLLMTTAALAIDPGNDPSSALNVGALNTVPAVFTDFVGSNDTDDYYKFSVSATSKVQLSLTNMTDDADLALNNSQGNQIAASQNDGTTNDSITHFLDPGTYFVDVAALKTDGSAYTLTMSATPPLSTEGGHTTDTATNLGTVGTSTVTINGNISPTYSDSYYKFTLGSARSITVAGSGAPADTTAISIEDASGNNLGSPDIVGTFNFVTPLPAATYYFHVQSQAAITSPYKFTLAFSAPPMPDAGGNTPDTATPLGTLNAPFVIKDQVGNADPNDYYSFTVPVAQTITLTLTGLTGDADLALQGADGTFWGESINPDTTAESIKLSVPAGVYDADAMFFDTGSASYTLTITPSVIVSTVPDNAGNTPALARDAGVLSGAQSFSDFVGPADTNDYYKFTLNNKSTVSINLGGLGNNADVQLLNSSAGVLATSSKTGTTSDNITQVLDVGTYYVRVYPVSGAATNYTLTLNGTLYDGAGNSLAAALNVGTLTGTKTFKDFVGAADTDDYYKFTLATRSTVAATLGGLQDDANLELLGSTGNVLTNSTNTGTTPDSVSQLLDPGTYYIHVLSASPATNYALTLNTTIFDGAGNTLATARDLGTPTGTTTINDWVGTTDTNDYYTFFLPAKTDMTITLAGMSANADLQLLNSGGTVVATSANTGTTADTLVKSLDLGVYYLRVYPVGTASTPYKLTLTSALHDGGGSTMATAGNLGMLAGFKTFNDSVSSTDALDYFRFVTPVDGNYTFNLTGANGGAHLALLTSGGTQFANATSLSLHLSAGTTYYAVVSSVSSFANYTLTLNGPSPLNVGTLVGAKSFNGSINSTTTSTYYTFSLSAAAPVRFSLGNLSADADIRVFDLNGNQLARETFQQDGSSSALVPSLAIGSYYVVVTSPSDTGYSLTMVGPNLSDDSVAGATNIGTLTGTTLTYSNSLSTTDATDFYKFTLASSRTVALTLSGLTSDGNLQLLASNGTSILATSAKTGVSTESISLALSAGTYYVRVYRGGTTGTNYTLTVK